MLTGGIAALLKAFGRRVEAGAAQDQASAAGVLALVAQVERLNARCDQMAADMDDLRDQLDAERAERQHWQQRFHEEAQAHTATKALAASLRAEYQASLERTRPSHKSERPGPMSQRKA